MRLDDVVPRPDHVTRQARWIAAEPAAVWAGLHGVRLSGLPVTLTLSAARFLPVVLSGRGLGQVRDRPFLDAVPVPKLSSEPPTAVVFGGLLQPWRLTGGEAGPRLDAAGLLGWNAPGWIKAALDFRLEPRDGGTELSSETRVAATDDASRRSFARYWRIVGPGSTATRWEVLTAVELRAGTSPGISDRR